MQRESSRSQSGHTNCIKEMSFRDPRLITEEFIGRQLVPASANSEWLMII